MNWDLLKKYNYFNPYQEYEGYRLNTCDDFTSLPNQRIFENITITFDNTHGNMTLSFKTNYYIVALDIILFFLIYETMVKFKTIENIVFNETEVFNESMLVTWKNAYNSNSYDICDVFGLKCETLLKKDNYFIINFKEDHDFENNSKQKKFKSFAHLLIYKSTKEFDNEYFLRETLDEWKIK